MTTIKGFQRVASAYDANEVRLAVTALEGAGYIAITPGLILNHVTPHRSFAFGPIPILVPEADAESARALLRSIQSGSMGVLDPAPADPEEDEVDLPQDRTLWRKVLDAVGFGLAGVSHPRDRLSVDGPPPTSPEGPP
jgi:hypothetical protein